ncbi:Hypothetical protein R9X50_00439400 [Acrodontium crateriforme]|uniref:Uncharacterized protein n=1 Tax=Acrodontium crateriforme TaxID=150365 RepID=A0AAQ3MAX4_9PEZI|nr:Hypothetical protein R9X50_00439400 [Acrodontium crateriforme]
MSNGNRPSERSSPRNRRPLYARPPPPPPPRNNRQHSALGYWLPLIVTGTIAVGGLAAWVWATRNDDDDDGHYPPVDQKPPGPPYQPGPPGAQGPMPPYQGPPPSQSGGPPPVSGQGAASSYYNTQTRETKTTTATEEDNSFYGQVRGVIRRTPSPEQFFSRASKHVSAGMAAAGAALGSIVEEGPRRRGDEDREGFSDHERWSEEADDPRRVNIVDAESERRAEAARMGREDATSGRSKRTVAVIVSADANMDGTMDEEDVGYMEEHASILSHLPANQTSDNTNLIILIYAPGMTALPPLTYRPSSALSGRQTPTSPTTPTLTPGTEIAEPIAFPSPGGSFDALWTQALGLVSSPSNILPFTTLEGYVHILRHLAPQTVYVPNSLSGNAGASIGRLAGWVGHTILVVGDEATGGLADTETEDESPEKVQKDKWYETSSLVGLGKSVEIVDVSRVGDDWSRRIASQS